MVIMMECMTAVLLLLDGCGQRWWMLSRFERLVDGLYIDISISFGGLKHGGTITSLFRFIFDVLFRYEAANERTAFVGLPSEL
jgi:hypothetical protein